MRGIFERQLSELTREINLTKDLLQKRDTDEKGEEKECCPSDCSPKVTTVTTAPLNGIGPATSIQTVECVPKLKCKPTVQNYKRLMLTKKIKKRPAKRAH